MFFGCGAAAVTLRIGAKGWQIDDGHVRHEGNQRFTLWPDQQIANEMRVPGIFGHHADRQRIVFIRAAHQVLNEQVAVR